MAKKQKNYYTSRKVAGGYVGRIYTYDEAGNTEIKVWESQDVFTKKGEAEDAATDHAEDNDIEVELG